MIRDLRIGAIHKNTGVFTRPSCASKNEYYECPECNIKAIFKKGEIKRPHFAHYAGDKNTNKNGCNFFEKPSETQLHKNGKSTLKSLLDSKTPLVFIRRCCCCYEKTTCLELNESDYAETYKAETEHKLKFMNRWIYADVAFLSTKFIIFEILHTHKTLEENRPEPWVEIKAVDLCIELETNKDGFITFNCQRVFTCEKCIKNEEEKKLREKIAFIRRQEELEIERKERQERLESEEAERQEKRRLEYERKEKAEAERKEEQRLACERMAKVEAEREIERKELQERLEIKEAERQLNWKIWCEKKAKQEVERQEEELLKREIEAKREIERVEKMRLDEIERQEEELLKREIEAKREIERVEKMRLDEIERKKREIERAEILRANKEELDRQLKEEKDLWLQRQKESNGKCICKNVCDCCKCGISLKNLCRCESPSYEIVKINGQLWCNNSRCRKWKCRCV
jgi:hypothetical protein